MRLLFVTQKVDERDAVLGFAHRWIEEFARHRETVTVICLYEGIHHLPSNVRILSLGKESGVSRVKYVFRFYRYIFGFRHEYDAVFVHMNPEYVVLGGLFWRLWKKRVALWYSHKSNTWKLRIAVRLAHIVFTTAPKSVTFASTKLRYMGHGIEVEKYQCGARSGHREPVILTVGRITKIKRCEMLLEAIALLRSRGFSCTGVIAGGPVNDADRAYDTWLRARASELGIQDAVEFTGSIPVEKLLVEYCRADISVNMVPTGGLDKSVLEGMAAENLVLSSNEVFREYFGAYADRLMFKTGDANDLAEKITLLWKADDRERVRLLLQRTADRFDVRLLIKDISNQMQTFAI